MEINGKRRVVPVLISNHIYRALSRVITLEAIQLHVNPLIEKLEKYAALLCYR